MTHILEGDDYIIFGCHVISQVVINNKSEELVQESEINFVVEFFEFCLHQDDTLVLRNIPHIG